jgi:uncharacterized protein YbjT (DUF2867 family)
MGDVLEQQARHADGQRRLVPGACAQLPQLLKEDADSRFAPIAGSDIALTAAKVFTKPEEHGGQTYTLTGPVEYSHEELAAEVSRVLGKDLPYEQVTVTTFLELIGLPDDTAKLKHFEAVTIDQQEGRLAGVSDAAPNMASPS